MAPDSGTINPTPLTARAMFRIDFPFTEAHLLLTPRLGGMSRYTQVAILALILGVLLFLIFRLYRHELKLIPRRFALLLLGLRLALIACLFLVTSMKPALARTVTETVPSKVLIAVDRSDSMGIADPQRSQVEKLELAKGLNLVREFATDSTLDGWLREARNGAFTPADKEAYDKVVARIDGLTRHQVAERVLSPDGANVLKAIGDKHLLDAIQFTQQTGDLPKEWDKLKPVLNELNLRPPGNAFTDLKQPFVRAIERGGSGEGKLLGVVVLTDGQHNWGLSPLNKARELGQRGVPVYFVALGAKDPPPDLAVLSVKATPPTVFKNAYSTIEARVLINNLPKGMVKVTLTYPEGPEGKTAKKREPLVEVIDHDGTSGPRLVTFTARMDRPGTETLTVTAEHEPADANDPRKDTRPENNTRPVVVNVSPDKAKVLLVDGELRWEFHYLHTALVRDETMDTTSVVFDQPRINAVTDETAKKMGLPDLSLPRDPEALMGYDCIILGDVSPDQIGRAERDKLEKYVSERGGTLVLLAGKRSMPMEYLREGETLAKLLPIAVPKVVRNDAGFRVTLTAEGQQTGFLRMEPNAGLSAETWANLPPHYWAVTGRAKDGAVTLAYVPPPGMPKDAAAARDAERDNALIVRQNFGFGKVVYVGIDSTWRWRFKKGDTYNHRFWSQVIRWAASDRALVAGNEFVRFGAREPVYRADEEVEVIARLSDKVKKLSPDALAGARLLRKTKAGGPEEVVGLMPLKPHPVIPREFDGAQANLPPGEYDMELVIPDIEEKLNGPDGKKLRAHFQVLPADTGEMLDLGTNWMLMEDIAAKSGGKVFPAERAAELAELLQSRSATREYAVEQKMWQSWWTLILFIVLLSVEWFVRKFAGLP
ncbi:MAG TPA: hypothetical protein VKE40_08390 [Gemmataceae bacterium]|nr:hypothetical protein [Gemmataceae bacterium]